MNKFSTRFIIVLLTFVIGISSAAGWFYYQESQRIQIISPNSQLEAIGYNGINEGKGGIKQATKLAGLPELRKTLLKKGDIEIRVWRGFGLSPLEAVILKREGNQWSAKHIKTDNYYDFEKVEVKQLNAPKSGWETFWKQIVNKEILTLPDSSEIGCNIYTIDGVGYVVEINQERIYRIFSYPTTRRCNEAIQMEEIGEIIGEEFDSGIEECREEEWFACTKARKSNKEKKQ